ncbi:MAG: hypothetical protein ACSNEK_08565 [Parachlamydiaceae bacterium]
MTYKTKFTPKNLAAKAQLRSIYALGWNETAVKLILVFEAFILYCRDDCNVIDLRGKETMPGFSMRNTYPKKFALIGLPGSGKSTFASKLGKILDIPVHHLDRHRFEPDGNKRDKQEFIEIQRSMLEETAWIVEGCSFSTFEMRFAKADILIYFHFSRLVCFWRFFKRLFNYKKDFGGLRAINWELLKYTWNFDKEKRARIEELREKYPQTEFLIFKTSKDAEFFLKQSGNSFLNPAESCASKRERKETKP